MKIAFVSQPIDTVLPPFQNSVGACTYGAACSLAKSNDVTVYGLQDSPGSASEIAHRGVRFRSLPVTAPDRLRHKLRANLSKFVQMSAPLSVSRWLYPDYGRDVARELAKERFDVIHIQHCSQYVPVVREWNLRARIVLHLHAEWFSQCNPASLGTRLRGLDLLTAVSGHIANKTRRDLPAFAARCETVYNGVNIEEFQAERDYPAAGNRVKRIMYAGGVSPHKGIHVLLDAFKIVVAQYSDVQLDIIGPHGSYPLEETFDLRDRAAIKSLAPFYSKNRLSLLRGKLTRSSSNSDTYVPHLRSKVSGVISDKVAFLGMIPRPELIQHYYGADVFVFPPIWDEGFGIPPVEAMAAGTPVVATRSGAIVETIQHGETGLLVEKNDPRPLADALLTLLTNDAMRERMGRAGRHRAATHFTWDCAAEKMQRLYLALCSAEAREETKPAERLSLANHQ